MLPRYFGDIKDTDFEDPHKKSHCWKLVKKTVANQKRRIKQLQDKNRLLKNRVYSLQSLTKHLRQKNLISENAQLTLNVS